MSIYDVIVIGGGAVGCAVLRELSKYNITAALVEKESDVARGTSGKNSAVVHAGFNYKPGSRMAKFCVEGNQGFEKLSKDLDFPYKKTGKVLIAFDENDIKTLEGLVEKGKANGVKDLKLIDKKELHELEPNVGGIAGMWSGETAITNVFLYTIALAENAVQNGASLLLDYEVVSITKNDDGNFVVKASDGRELVCKYLINSAGCYADKIASMCDDNRFKVYPYKGEYLIMDKKTIEYCKHPIYPAPQPGYLGVHITPTDDDNLIIGPSAEFVDNPEDVGTTQKMSDELFIEAKKLLPPLQLSQVITSYAGMRSRVVPPGEAVADFYIEYSECCNNLINIIGIESPGLTSSVPIAKYTIQKLGERLELNEKNDFMSKRKGIERFRFLSLEEQAKLIEEDPDFGEIICRCENVTRREILDAINNPLGVKNIVGIKLRTRATMGRCQGGYCLTRITKILVDEFGADPKDIKFNSKDSYMYVGNVK